MKGEWAAIYAPIPLWQPGGLEVLGRSGSADGEEDGEENETVEEAEGHGEKEDLSWGWSSS